MKNLRSLLTLALLAATAALAQDPAAGDTNLSAGESLANYNQAIELRTDDILKLLPLTDAAKRGRVHDVIVTQYHQLKAWHSANDAKLKSVGKDTNAVAEIRATLKTIHNDYLAKLSAELTPAQVDIVKDKMVYNKVQVTYNAYCSIIPVLTDVQKAHILAVLQEAREEAMDGGSVNEKSAIFKKYKGRIANYLAKEGINETQFRKAWFQKYQAQKGTNAAPAQ